VDTEGAVYRLQQMTTALLERDDLSASEGRAVVDLYRACGQVLGLFRDLG